MTLAKATVKDDRAELRATAAELRRRIVSYSHHASVPHLGSCLSCVDILTALYFSVLNIDPRQPQKPTRDRFVLSKGHAAPALFQVLAMRGFYPESDMFLPDHGNGVFGEHPPTPEHLAGVEAATGSLGHGFPMASGMALAGKIAKLPYHVYALLSDGECNEGSVWESAMFASAKGLDNLTILVDYNKWQATGRSNEVLSLSPLVDKWAAFGWQTMEIDGHDIDAILDALHPRHRVTGKPLAIVAHTVKGKGVSFMEDDNNWHYRTPTADEVARATRELIGG